MQLARELCQKQELLANDAPGKMTLEKVRHYYYYSLLSIPFDIFKRVNTHHTYFISL